MQRKRNEVVFGNMMRAYGYYTHKWRDRGYVSCPHCHMAITKCPYCKQDLLLEKAQTKPDFLVAMEYVYVEAKGAKDSWAFTTSIRDTQRQVAKEAETYLFLEIGPGRVPKGKQAFLVPWEDWEYLEKELLEMNFKSLIFERTARSRMPTAKEILGGWELVWENGNWTIPEDHIFWERHKRINGTTK